MSWTADVKESVYSVFIGIAFVLISAALVPYLAQTIVSPFVAEHSFEVFREWFYFDTAVTLLSLMTLSIIFSRFGVSWKGIAERGGIIGILAGMIVLSYFGSQKILTTALAIALTWSVSVIIDRRNGVKGSDIPWMPILFLISFIVFVSTWYVMNGSGPEDILEDGTVIFIVAPAYLAIALPGVGKGGYTAALVVDALWILLEVYALSNAAENISGIDGIANVVGMLVWLGFSLISPIASERMFKRAEKVRRYREANR